MRYKKVLNPLFKIEFENNFDELLEEYESMSVYEFARKWHIGGNTAINFMWNKDVHVRYKSKPTFDHSLLDECIQKYWKNRKSEIIKLNKNCTFSEILNWDLICWVIVPYETVKIF